jgi:hypothetical protein
MTAFWRNWLTVWCWFVAGFGLVLAGAGLPATDGISTFLFTTMHGAAPVWDEGMRFSTALMGAVTMGWGLTTLAAVRGFWAMGKAARPFWRMLLLSFLVWFVIDSTLSIVNGFALNAVSNLLIMAAFALPLWRSGLLGGGAMRTA